MLNDKMQLAAEQEHDCATVATAELTSPAACDSNSSSKVERAATNPSHMHT
jgi:hypothetical protein